MVIQRYRIYELSARAVMSYATEENGIYKYDLDAAAVDHCLVSSASHEQDSNALFFQILCKLYSGRYREVISEDVSEVLSEIIFYMNFQHVSDTRGLRQREIIRQKKAESMFRPEGISLDFGHGSHRYLAFERSGSMSRESRLSFIREDFYEPVRKRIMLDLEIKSCQLSKLYAYNGLMLSSGKRIEGIGIEKKHRVIVVDNPKLTTDREFMVTVQDDGSNNSTRKFYRQEKLQEVKVTCFDGEGLISKAYAEKLDIAYCGAHIHSSFQIRMPYVKGMLHEVDFLDFFKRFHVKMIEDAWGKMHPVESIDIILTTSQFKAFGWFRDCGRDWNDYWKAFRKYNHALYITNVSKEIPEGLTQLNYQFLATVSIQPEEFRPSDLPGGWDHSPEEDERNWLTKATEQRYYDLLVDESTRRAFFLEALSKPGISKHSKDYYMAAVLKKNPLFLNEPVYTKQLDDRAEQILKDYAVGRLLVPGDIRYLSGDLLALLYHIANKNAALAFEEPPFRTQVLADEFAKNSFYAPGAVYEKEDNCTLLRNPHIARNEEIQLSVYPEDALRDHYFGHLTDVVMVDAKMLAAERLGGADYDGDLVRTIADPILNACVRRNYEFEQHGLLSNNVNLPLLNIPSMASPKQNPDDWYARFVTVKNTFSARIGQICNAALDRSVIAYNEKTDPKQRKKLQEETEVLAILSGLEIDAAKTGIRPDLSDYLGRKIQRTPFLKYKALVEEAEERREWYEDTHREKLNKFFTATDWETVDSPVERLPLLARQIQKGTKKPRTRKAKDEELFLFAREKDWQAKLNPHTLERVGALVEDYEGCLKRIRSCRAPAKEHKRKTDIERILYRRGQEDVYDPDELYALFQTVDSEILSKLRSAIREENWHLMPEAQREAFLLRWLPGEEFEEWYDLLMDFRQYGFRMLGDVVGDIDDANNGADRKQVHRVGDSEAFAAMMQAYIDHPRAKYYRDAVAREGRNLMKEIVNLNHAVRYLVALGRRDLLWDFVPELIERNVLEVKEDANEVQEFQDYTQSPDYTGKNILGRFTVESIRDFLGFERIFTILARGYLFRGGDPYDNVETARKALCAWCSIPERTPKGWDGEFTTCFSELHGEFPELVDENGCGWYIRHIRAIASFAKQNPKKVKAGVRALFPEKLSEYEIQWRKKVRQFQISIFQESTDAIWQLRFDDIIAGALTLGSLRDMEAELTEQQKEKLLPFVQDKVKLEHLTTLIAYYEANKPEDSDWVVLPATAFNNYFGSTVFSKQVLRAVTGTVIERSDMSYGSGRYRVLEAFL